MVTKAQHQNFWGWYARYGRDTFIDAKGAIEDLTQLLEDWDVLTINELRAIVGQLKIELGITQRYTVPLGFLVTEAKFKIIERNNRTK